jgi:hypothetical protein
MAAAISGQRARAGRGEVRPTQAKCGVKSNKRFSSIARNPACRHRTAALPAYFVLDLPRTVCVAFVWSFSAPLGNLDVVMLPLTEVLTVSRHLRVDTVESWLASMALRDLRDPDTPPPVPQDEQGRSAQQYVVDVAITQGGTTRRARTTGRDIYAVSAPIIVEATARLLGGKVAPRGRVASRGEIFDARDFLAALDMVTVSYGAVSSPILRRGGES